MQAASGQVSLRLIHFADYFYVLRPVLFFPAWTTMMAGYLAVWNKTVPDPRHIEWINADLLWIGFSSALIMGAGFIINQLQDAETDRINVKLFFLAENLLSRRTALTESAFLLATGIMLAAFFSFELFFLYLAAVLFFMIGYNYPPFVWKNGVWGSLLANAGMGAFAFAFGWITMPLSLFDFVRDVMPYLFFNTAMYLLTTVPDMDGDRQSGKRTMSVAFGLKTTVMFSAVLYAGAVVSSFLGGDYNLLFPVLALLPFYAGLLIRPDRERTMRTIKFGLFFFSLMIGFYFPLYLLVILLFFIVTRWYYKKRFGILYPSFRSE